MSDTAVAAVFPVSTAPEAPTNGVFGRSAEGQPQPAAQPGPTWQERAAARDAQVRQEQHQQARQEHDARAARLNSLFPNSSAQGATEQPQPAQGQPPASQEGKPAEGAQASQEGSQQPAEGGDPDIGAYAAELGLDPAHADSATVAQAARDLGINKAGLNRLFEVQQTMQARQSEAWRSETEAYLAAGNSVDLIHARRGMAHFATPGIREALDRTGLGNHPEFVKLFARLGRLG